MMHHCRIRPCIQWCSEFLQYYSTRWHCINAMQRCGYYRVWLVSRVAAKLVVCSSYSGSEEKIYLLLVLEVYITVD